MYHSEPSIFLIALGVLLQTAKNTKCDRALFNYNNHHDSIEWTDTTISFLGEFY